MIKEILSFLPTTRANVLCQRTPVSFQESQWNCQFNEKEITTDLLKILKNEAPLDSNWVEQFEDRIAVLCESPYCIGVGSGTDALTIAIRSLNIPKDSVVLVPGFSFISTAVCILENGLRPCFLDVDPSTGLVKPDEVLNKMGEIRPKAVIIPHLYGNMVDLREVSATAKKQNIWMIEDAAQALGSTFLGAPAGHWGDLACLSFDPQKILGAFGSAGAVLTRDADLAQRVRQIRHYGCSAPGKFNWPGLNSRVPTLQAYLLTKKLEHFSALLSKRRSIESTYRRELAGIPGVSLLTHSSGVITNGYRLVIKVSDRDTFQSKLLEAGIETRIHYPYCLYHQSFLKNFSSSLLPGCEELSKTSLSLPCHSQVTARQLAHTIETVQKVSSGII